MNNVLLQLRRHHDAPERLPALDEGVRCGGQRRDRCPSSCEEQTTSPNGNAGADGMASIIAHESEEAISDPDVNAWYDSRGEENADKCAWTFGQTYSATNGSLANMNLGGSDFLIQRNWVNASGGYCGVKI